MRSGPTTNDFLALLLITIGLGIGGLCFWQMDEGNIGVGGGVAGMVIGSLMALPPLLFWNIDKQRWEVTFRIESDEKAKTGKP